MNLITYSNVLSASMVASGVVICGLAVKNAGLVAAGTCAKIGALVADHFNNEKLAQNLRSNGNRFINLAKLNIKTELKITAALAAVGIASMVARSQLTTANIDSGLSNDSIDNRCDPTHPFMCPSSKLFEVQENIPSTIEETLPVEVRSSVTHVPVKVDQFPGVTDLDLYESLEEKITHTFFDKNMLEPYHDRLEQFPESHLFRLMRLALIKNNPSELYQILLEKVGDKLSINSKQILQGIQSKIILVNNQNAQIKQQILQNSKNKEIKLKDKNEEEGKIKEHILPHAEKLMELYKKHCLEKQLFNRGTKGVNYFDGGETAVLELDALPGIIFKFVHDDSQISLKYENANRVQQVCEKHGLHNLRIPQSVIITELLGQPVKFLAEEKLDILTWGKYEERLQLMNSDPQLLPIANEFLRQLTVLIIETGLIDICSANVGLLRDGSGLGIIDVDKLNHFPGDAIYGFQQERNLISHVYPPNFDILRETLLENDHEKYKEIDFQKYEDRRRSKCGNLERQQRLWAKNGVLEASDPIDFDHRLLAELSIDDQLKAISMVNVLNEALLAQNTPGRRISYSLEKLMKLPAWNWDIEKRKEICKFLIKKEIISGPESERGMTIWLNC